MTRRILTVGLALILIALSASTLEGTGSSPPLAGAHATLLSVSHAAELHSAAAYDDPGVTPSPTPSPTPAYHSYLPHVVEHSEKKAYLPLTVDGERTAPAGQAAAAGEKPSPLPTRPAGSEGGATCAGLVVRRGDQLLLDGEPYTFVGTNVSYLAKSNLPEAEMGTTIEDLSQEGVDVIRVWTEIGVDLDRVARMLDLGQKYGVRFILTLEDYYFDKSESWFDSTYNMRYIPHVRQVVRRFHDHPAVLMWELMNEPNCSPEGQSQSCLNALYEWAEETTEVVRDEDACRPISIGTIWIGGYTVPEETQFERLHRISGVGIISVHKPSTAWYPREISLAEKLDMPIFFGEIHHEALDKGCQPISGKVKERAEAIEDDVEAAAKAGIDGYLLWQFAHEPLEDENGNPLYYCGVLDYYLDDPAWDVLRGSALDQKAR